jgi:acyl carrier protein
MDTLQKKLSTILEVDEIKLEMVLVDLDSWDSLTCLSIIAMALDDYKIRITNEQILESKTVEGLIKLIQN